MWIADVGLRWSVVGHWSVGTGVSEEQRHNVITHLTTPVEEAGLSINCSQPVESSNGWHCPCVPNGKTGSTSPDRGCYKCPLQTRITLPLIENPVLPCISKF
jgi:hypothetical protein